MCFHGRHPAPIAGTRPPILPWPLTLPPCPSGLAASHQLLAAPLRPAPPGGARMAQTAGPLLRCQGSALLPKAVPSSQQFTGSAQFPWGGGGGICSEVQVPPTVLKTCHPTQDPLKTPSHVLKKPGWFPGTPSPPVVGLNSLIEISRLPVFFFPAQGDKKMDTLPTGTKRMSFCPAQPFGRTNNKTRRKDFKGCF